MTRSQAGQGRAPGQEPQQGRPIYQHPTRPPPPRPPNPHPRQHPALARGRLPPAAHADAQPPKPRVPQNPKPPAPQDPGTLTVSYVTVVPFFRVTESFRLGVAADMPRRDLRPGRQTAVAKRVDGGARVQMEWGQPLAGARAAGWGRVGTGREAGGRGG